MSRDMILARVRRNVKAMPGRLETVEARLTQPSTRRMDWVPISDEGLVGTFIEKAKLASATVERVSDGAALVAGITAFLRERNLPMKVRTGTDKRLQDLLSGHSGTLEILQGKAEDADEVGLSHALAGLAESGTLILTSGPDNPSTLNFLPPNHLVVVRAGDIIRSQEEMWARFKRKTRGVMPRTVNFITGPSRSADIEQTLLLGAHGPKNLHIFILESDA